MAQSSEKKDRLPIFRQRLNELLGEMSTTEFAEKVGLSRQTMGFYLNGDRIPDSITLSQICKACGVTADWLLGLTNDPCPKPCAVDDLGLSPEAVAHITHIAQDADAIHCLNLILGNQSFLTILDKIKTIPTTIVAEAEYMKRIFSLNHEGAYIENLDDPEKKVSISDLGMLGASLAAEMTCNALTVELVSAHPELKNRVIVMTGRDAIERQIEEIGERFATIIRYTTGFYELDHIMFGRCHVND